MSELPGGWEWTQLAELVEVVRGVTYKKQDSGTEPGDGLVPIVRATNINERLETDADLVYVPESVVRPAQLIRAGDIVLASSSGSASVVGKSAVASEDWGGAFGAFCTLLRPLAGVDARYIGHYVASPSVRRRWSGLASGTNINNLKREHLAETQVPLAPLAEQRRIVAAIEEHLSRLDAALAQLRASELRLQRLRMRILEEAVSGSWNRAPFGDVICELRNGVFVSRPSLDPPGIPIFRISAVRPMALDINDIRYASIAEAAARAYFVESGDLLFTRYSGNPAFVGACAAVPPLATRTLHPDKLIRVVLDQTKALPEYLELAFASRSVRREVEARLKTTAGQVGIAGGQLRTVPVPLPPVTEQHRIVMGARESLTAADALVGAIGRAAARAEVLRRSILACAFRGELVPQDPRDESASVLRERIASDRAAAPMSTPRRESRSVGAR